MIYLATGHLGGFDNRLSFDRNGNLEEIEN